jgi:hypothetical protein
MKMICFDMDGTIADLYAVPNWLDKLRSGDASPYAEATPMWDMKALREVLLKLVDRGYEIRIISWLSKDSTEEYKTAVRKAKREWLAKYNFPADKCHFIAYGRTKADCIRHIADAPAFLIDDNKKVRDGWHLGESIDPTEVNLLEILSALD